MRSPCGGQKNDSHTGKQLDRQNKKSRSGHNRPRAASEFLVKLNRAAGVTNQPHLRRGSREPTENQPRDGTLAVLKAASGRKSR